MQLRLLLSFYYYIAIYVMQIQSRHNIRRHQAKTEKSDLG